MTETELTKDGAVEVELDSTHCCASGVCAAIAPDAFAVDPGGFALVRPGAAATPLPRLLEAARSCPTLCIAVRRDGAEIDLFS
jgi:ferredoxin